jgi:nicotinamide-nucleotide amidase
MNFRIRVCCQPSEIRDRLEQANIERKYSLEGEGLDYSICFIDELTEDEIEIIFDAFSDVYYGNNDEDLPSTLVSLLYENGMTIACAESITGGMIASSIVDISGCSEVFYEGIVAYSNISKMDRLGVGEDTLIDCGAVSEETAIEMANGLINDRVSVAVSTTGIAGPTGGTQAKPIGLTYISVVSEGGTECFKCFFKGDRNEIRRQARDYALFKTLLHIKNYL